jgi:hypothetical protein
MKDRLWFKILIFKTFRKPKRAEITDRWVVNKEHSKAKQTETSKEETHVNFALMRSTNYVNFWDTHPFLACIPKMAVLVHLWFHLNWSPHIMLHPKIFATPTPISNASNAVHQLVWKRNDTRSKYMSTI